MRKTLLILIPLGFLLILGACKKTSGPSTKGLTGTWTFLGMTAQTQTTSPQTGGVTMVANSVYVTKNNTGTISFKTDSMVVSGLGYVVDTSVTAYFYYNNIVFDSASQAVSFSIPPTSATAKYSAIGTDSLYFPNGGILSALDSAATGQGSTYTLKGDSLTIFSQGVDSSGGVKTAMKATINLKRQ
ncbi:MAG TPA: hypothetical protein VNW04_24435 [Puia sp.]|jgi:hypothetical protein|nr:hypothetical protein [Puia sp.]